ncbi:MAG: glycosyltransferase, partial [Bdellovibrio sp.]
MLVIILGLPYFAKKVAHSLSEENNNHHYIALNTSEKIIDKIRFLLLLPFCSTVYSISGTTSTGGALKLALALKKKIVMHWVGTDVILAQKVHREGDPLPQIIHASKHLCEVSWIQSELREIGIEAKIVQIASFDQTTIQREPLPKSFSILTYLSKNREIFYGMEKVTTLAKKFPHIEIRIAGISAYNKSLPPNIKLLGWVRDMAAEYKKCSLYLRLPEHDGLAFSVLEALAYGRYVGYSQDYDGTEYIDSEKKLIEYTQLLLDKHNKNELPINSFGIKWVTENFDRKTNMALLNAELL